MGKPENLREILKDETSVQLALEMMSKRRILAISPHPDDSEIIAGGFLAGAVIRNASIKLVVVSDGRKGSTTTADEEELVKIRKDEQMRACEVLGIREVEFLGYIDSEIPEPRSIRSYIMNEIRKHRADLVITTDPTLEYEAHLDHVHVGRAVMESVLLLSHQSIGKGKVYPGRPALALGAPGHPNLVLDVAGTFETKMNAISCHESQLQDIAYVREGVLKVSRRYGSIIGAEHGEPFTLLHGEDLHMNVPLP